MGSTDPARPNVVYILGDDHRQEQLACRGNPVVRTPHLDALAGEGVLFTHAFCTSPACTPSRTGHYLGQWERRHGVNFNSYSAVAPAAWEQSFPQRLRAAGYWLGWVGKNHVPAGEGGYASPYFADSFDYFYGNHGHSGFYPKEMAHIGAEIYTNAAADTQVEIFSEGARNFLTPEKRFLDGCRRRLAQRDETKPFCLCVTFNLPHAQGTGTMELRPSDDEIYRSLYRDRFGEIPIPATYVPFRDLDPENRRLPRDVYSGHYLPSYDYVRDERVLRERRVREYQTITGMDRFVGELREELDRRGLGGNTVIVFSTDHGIHHGEHGLGGKCFLYEEDLRIPLIVYDPRLPAAARGQVRDECVAVPDFAPTVLELCGVAAPASMQGTSLVPLLRGERPPWREELFTEQLMDIQNYPRSESVRTREWKYIRYFKRTEDPRQAGRMFRGTLDNYNDCLVSSLRLEQPVYEELYHLGEDPGEVTNLARDPACRPTLEHFRARVVALGRELKGDLQAPPLTVRL
jgi:arylsulfatase A-like enzyme